MITLKLRSPAKGVHNYSAQNLNHEIVSDIYLPNDISEHTSMKNGFTHMVIGMMVTFNVFFHVSKFSVIQGERGEMQQGQGATLILKFAPIILASMATVSVQQFVAVC